ncbi:MAG: carbohydrate ABC transporter permease [Spirochaetaceae bacterium]|nr:carbohydrate ABC transporter permease [Spirochaetaceae bacterium]
MNTYTRKIHNIREGSRIADFILYTLAVFIVFITLYPMYYVLILSVSEPRYALNMEVYTVPKGFDLGSYLVLIKNNKIWRAFFNTVVYVIAGTGLMLISSAVSAFPLTYKGLPGRKYVNMYLLFTMFFSGGLIPSFLLVMRLGMYDSPLALIIPGCFSVWNIILVKSYFSTVPETLREAAKIDGASVYQILLRVYLPLSTPILAVIAVYTIVGTWNSWFGAMVYLPSLDWQPLQLYLRRMLIDELSTVAAMLSSDAVKEMEQRKLAYAQLKYAMIIFTSLPVLFTYPFFQKYFMKGIMLGSLKE